MHNFLEMTQLQSRNKRSLCLCSFSPELAGYFALGDTCPAVRHGVFGRHWMEGEDMVIHIILSRVKCYEGQSK